MPKYCNECGCVVDEDEVFCPECGSNLNAQLPVKKGNFFNNNKNAIIILITIIIVVLVIAITLTVTQELNVGTQTVSVGGLEFEIPGDYVIDPKTIDVDYSGYTLIFSQGYTNNKEGIYISVMTLPYGVDGDDAAASQGGVHKTLMNARGYYTENNGAYTFAFADGTYLIVVSVTNPDLFNKIKYLA